MGKVAASGGTVAINEAFVAIQEDATAVFVAFQDHALLFGSLDAIAKEIFETHPGTLSDGLHLPFLQAHGGVAAAVGAGQTVCFLLDRVGHVLQFTFDEDVAFEVHAQAQVLIAFLFAEAFNLDEVGNERAFAHTSIMKYS